ncbi:MAG: hypothetical protein RLZZ301_824 [Bacteroidota bacterium]|jgi:4-hydroxy-3-methylbut-2-enyl diphosphate reductase
MKQFEVPAFYRSPIISKLKAKRKLEDPRKKDFSPSVIDFGKIRFILARHFGFCYGVENAIERSYKAIAENPGKRIFLLSQMIHNPAVNEDLEANGIQFLQSPDGQQLIPFESLSPNDVVLIPAFGTTLEIENKLKQLGIDTQTYNTTCPFVEKVWNRSEKLGELGFTILIHGKHKHEETRATFSHADANAPSLVLKDIADAQFLAAVILGQKSNADFYQYFEGKYSAGFEPEVHLQRIGVVNQTTMLASETQEITDYLRSIMLQKYGEAALKAHMADTRDTLCYATNDNQSATYGLLEQDADLAVVVGGYNSSNTSHLVELLEHKFKTYFIKDASEIQSKTRIQHFDLNQQACVQDSHFLPDTDHIQLILTSGASCPDALLDDVMLRILGFYYSEAEIQAFISTYTHENLHEER